MSDGDGDVCSRCDHFRCYHNEEPAPGEHFCDFGTCECRGFWMCPIDPDDGGKIIAVIVVIVGVLICWWLK